MSGATGPAASCKMHLSHNAASAAVQLAAAEALSVKQDPAKFYYARGAGPLPVRGPAAYTEFSKAIFGDEATLGATPELLLTWGPRFGNLYKGGKVGALPWAVALWRYVTPQHPFLPSMHEVVSGHWTPRAHEVTAKLGAKVGDFCTMASLLAAMKALLAKTASGSGATKATTEKQGVWADVALAAFKPTTLAHVADGALGVAYQALAATLGAPLPSGTAAYDYRCRATVAWPTPGAADAVSRQKTWLASDAAGTKCKFVDDKTALSVWTEGDVARCYQSGTGSATATIAANRTAYADVRATVCQLWDATNAPFPYGACASGDSAAVKATKGCLACKKLAADKCDAACQAAANKTKHSVWRCAKAEYCMQLDPDHADNSTGASSGTWVLDTTVVNAAVARATTASKAADVAGLLYKVLDPVYAAPVEEVPCVTYAEANAAAHSRTFAAQLVLPLSATDKNTTALKWSKGLLKPVVYVGQRGRALACIANPTAPVCAGVVSGTRKDPSTAGAEGIARWNVLPKKICKMRATFAQTYPDCVQGTKGGALTAWTVPGANKTTGTDEAKASWQLRAAADWAPLTQTLEVSMIGSDALYCATLMPATTCKPQATPTTPAHITANANAFKAAITARANKGTPVAAATGRYIVAPRPLALFVDAHGALCTNLTGKVGAVAVARPSYAARAFMATVKAARFIDATTAVVATASTLKENTKLALTHLPAATFEALVPAASRAVRAAVAGAGAGA